MPNIFVFHCKSREKFKTILLANIYQYKVNDIILPKSTLSMLLTKNMMFMFNFPGLNFKILFKRKQNFYRFFPYSYIHLYVFFYVRVYVRENVHELSYVT